MIRQKKLKKVDYSFTEITESSRRSLPHFQKSAFFMFKALIFKITQNSGLLGRVDSCG